MQMDLDGPVTRREFNERFDQLIQRLDRMEQDRAEEKRKKEDKEQKKKDEEQKKNDDEQKEKAKREAELDYIQNEWIQGNYIPWIYDVVFIHKGDYQMTPMQSFYSKRLKVE